MCHLDYVYLLGREERLVLPPPDWVKQLSIQRCLCIMSVIVTNMLSIKTQHNEGSWTSGFQSSFQTVQSTERKHSHPRNVLSAFAVSCVLDYHMWFHVTQFLMLDLVPLPFIHLRLPNYNCILQEFFIYTFFSFGGEAQKMNNNHFAIPKLEEKFIVSMRHSYLSTFCSSKYEASLASNTLFPRLILPC